MLSLFVASLISGCSTTQSSPKPHKTKYTFQCLQVTAPDSLIQELTFSFDDSVAILKDYLQEQIDNPLQEQQITPLQQTTKPSRIPVLTHSQIEELIKKPDVEIIEFPIVYAGIGESVTNDQTKTVEMTVDADVVNGQVVYTKEPHRLGKEMSITVNKIEDTNITYHISLRSQKFVGFDEYKTTGGLVVKMPYFKSRGTHTEITQEPGVWIGMGGLIDQRDGGAKMNELLYIRIIPPINRDSSQSHGLASP